VQYLIKVENASSNRQGRRTTGGTSPFNRASANSGATTDDSNTEGEGDQEVWYELKDDNGDLYYFNTATGMIAYNCAAAMTLTTTT